jgi:hypothetical protein
VFEDSVEDREQLAHAGHQSHLLRFAGRQKTLVEFLHHRVATRGDQGAHIQRPSDLGSTSPHATMAVQSARVAFERSVPNQGGHSLVRERAQSSATPARAACGLGDRGPTADTLRRSASFSPNVWAALDGRLQVALGARELLLESPDVSLDAFGHRLGCRAQAIVLGGYHPE